MSSEWVMVGLLLLGQIGTVAAVVWKMGSSGGALTTEVSRLARAMEVLADDLAQNTTINAVQDTRLDNHEGRLGRLEGR